MSIDLVALASSSGLPIATRRVILHSGAITRGDDGELSTGIALNTVTTLYSLNLFSRLNECDLQLAKSADEQTKIRWKLFNNDSIVMLVVANQVDFLGDAELDSLLELTFDAIVMMCGLAEISDSNVERVKRTIKQAYPLVDHFLGAFVAANRGTAGRLKLITHCSHYAIATRTSYISSLVNSIAQTASSSYCALFVHRKLLVASKDWWSWLNRGKDSFLISCLLDSLLDIGLIQTKEVLIHLPGHSPSSRTRLVMSQITKGVVLCLLCGEQPSLESIESEILVPLSDLKLQEEKLSRYIYELRESKHISQATLRDILGKDEASSLLGGGVSAFLLVNYEHKVYFTLNDDLLEQYFEELISFCRFGASKSCSRHDDAYQIGGQTSLYRVCNKNTLLCTLFPSATPVKQMMLRTNGLRNAFCKAKHFWP